MASSAAASAAAISAATTRSTASATHSTGTTPAAVSRAIATRFLVRGNRISAPRWPARPRCRTRRPARGRCPSIEVYRRPAPRAAGRRRGRDARGMQPDPVLAELHRQRHRGQRQHESDEQQRDAAGDDGRQGDQRHQDQQAEMLGIPAAGEGQAAAGDHRGEDESDRRGDPVVDRGDRDDVHVGRGDAGGRQRDRTDPPAGPGVEPATPTPTSAPASTAPAPTRNSGRRMPAWAASTSSSTTPIRVTATPATASSLPIQPSERSRGGRGGVGRGGGRCRRLLIVRPVRYCRWCTGGQYGDGVARRLRYGCGRCGELRRRRLRRTAGRSSAVRSVETLAMLTAISRRSPRRAGR